MVLAMQLADTLFCKWCEGCLGDHNGTNDDFIPHAICESFDLLYSHLPIFAEEDKNLR